MSLDLFYTFSQGWEFFCINFDDQSRCQNTMVFRILYINFMIIKLLLIFAIQLWALLHFIMPTLFDSHEEFNEWFSKDIESHAEKQSGIDEGMWCLLMEISLLHFDN